MLACLLVEARLRLAHVPQRGPGMRRPARYLAIAEVLRSPATVRGGAVELIRRLLVESRRAFQAQPDLVLRHRRERTDG